MSVRKFYGFYLECPFKENSFSGVHLTLSEVDSVKELCKMRDNVLFIDLSKRDIQIFMDVICIS